MLPVIVGNESPKSQPDLVKSADIMRLETYHQEI